MRILAKNFSLLLAVLFLILPKDVYAYLDPGAGSYILQLIAATLFVGLFAVKNFWKQIKEFLKKLFSKNNQTPKKDEKNNKQDSKKKE